jgi:FkbM family methyltransferase
MGLFKNAVTLLTTPGMLQDWLRWELHHVGVEPSVSLPSGDILSGFRNFSEFRSGLSMVPPVQEMNFIENHAGLQGIILDVGANIGGMALTLSHLRPNCAVHAFEPSPETFDCLTANLARNQVKQIKPWLIAAGNEDGRQKFLNDGRSPATNRLLPPEADESGPSVEVNVVTLDSFLEQQEDAEVAFLKVDVEGYEPAVLLGAKQLLSSGRCQAGLVELCPENLHKAGYSVQDLITTVEDVGWCLRHLDEAGNPGMTVTVKNASEILLSNVALLPRD